MNKMYAAIRTCYGSPRILQVGIVEKPTPGHGEVLVKVHASTVNRTDCGILRAKPFVMRFFTGTLRPRDLIPGTDFAGEIAAIGKNVRDVKLGDRVFGFHDEGLRSQAQYLCISPRAAICDMPQGISFAEAAASAEGAHYAYNFVSKVFLAGGKRVLVNGATGAIGSAALQIAKYFGAHVTAVCPPAYVELIKSLGADSVIDFTKEDFSKGKQQYHFIFDTVGKSSFGRCHARLFPKGIYMSSELGAMFQNVFLALLKPIIGSKKVVFPFPKDCKRSLGFITDLIDQKAFKPVIDRSYPLSRIAEAYEYVESGQKIGNVIITMGH